MSKTEVEFQDLVAKAKEALITSKPKATKDDRALVEAVDPDLANALLAERSDLQDQIAVLTARKKEIEDILRDAINGKPSDEKKSLTVRGAVVATMSYWRETAVQTAVVKENFPVEDYPELYNRTSKSRLTIH